MFDAEARNHGLEQMPEHARRYARAEEFVDVVLRLWDSWDDDALRYDRAGSCADAVPIMPGLVTYVGSTEAEAKAKQRELDELLPAGDSMRQLGQFIGQDCMDWELDAPMPALPPLKEFAGPKGRYATILRIIATEQPTVRQLLGRLAAGGGHCTMVGTPEQIADEITRWFEHDGADGFNLMPPTLQGALRILWTMWFRCCSGGDCSAASTAPARCADTWACPGRSRPWNLRASAAIVSGSPASRVASRAVITRPVLSAESSRRRATSRLVCSAAVSSAMVNLGGCGQFDGGEEHWRVLTDHAGQFGGEADGKLCSLGADGGDGRPGGGTVVLVQAGDHFVVRAQQPADGVDLFLGGGDCRPVPLRNRVLRAWLPARTGHGRGVARPLPR